MVAIRIAGSDEDDYTMQLCDDALDEQDAKLVYGDYQLTPKGRELAEYIRQRDLQQRLDAIEPRNYTDFVMAVVGALLLTIAAVTWKWIW